MSEQKPEVGSIAWTDLTVNDAETIRAFYGEVVGWNSSPVNMGGYDDFSMTVPTSGVATAGICHARGANAELPTQWLVYIIVESVEKSVEHCRRLGGEVLVEPRGMGQHGRYCVIKDPAGAVAALYEPAG